MTKNKNFSYKYFLSLVSDIAQKIDLNKLDYLTQELIGLRDKGGRLIFLGVGGSASNSSHAVNDFRKLCNIDAISPIDNVSELTARTNDEGWHSVFSEWMKVSKCNENDALFIFSVGGGDEKKNVSVNLIKAIDEAKKRKMKIFGVVGKKNGYLNKKGDIVILIPVNEKSLITPLQESFQAIIWHSLVSHPNLKVNKTKW